MLIFDVFPHFCRVKKWVMDGPLDKWTNKWTDRSTDGQTDQQTDIPSFRDAWTHLKRKIMGYGPVIGPTGRPMDQKTDTPSYKVAWTHLRMVKVERAETRFLTI